MYTICVMLTDVSFPLFLFEHPRANRRKKLAKALERQARKLRAKGIAVDLESLRAEYLSQHQVTTESDLEDDDTQIDVVGDADSAHDADHKDHHNLLLPSSTSTSSSLSSPCSASASPPPPPLPQPPPPVASQTLARPAAVVPASVQPLLWMPSIKQRRDSLDDTSVESGESDSAPQQQQHQLHQQLHQQILHSQPASPKQSNQKRNSFSIDSLLYNRS